MLLTARPADRYEAGSGSQASFAYDLIRADILRGRHVPNKKLKVHGLASELGISPGAVREALFRLVSEQLVEAREQRGFAVTPISIAELQELTDLRCEIEAIACRRSVERGGLDWEGGLVAAHYRLRTVAGRMTEDDTVSLDYLSAHASFHEALAAAAGNARLLALRADLYEQYQRFRAFFAHLAGNRNLMADHDMLTELALARNAESVVRAMVEHLSSTTRRVVQATGRPDVKVRRCIQKPKIVS